MFAGSLSFSKASILFFYRRIFCLDGLWRNSAMLPIIYFMLAIIVIFGFGITFSIVFACGRDFHFWWSSAGADLKANCVDTQMLTYAHSVSDFIIDVIIIAIPIPPVWMLHMPTRRKLGVVAVFLTAGV